LCERMAPADEERTAVEGIELPILRLPIGVGDGAARVRARLLRPSREETLNASL